MKNFFSSELHNERTFYAAFVKDLKSCKKEVIIESPFITTSRMNAFRDIFNELIGKEVKVYIITRDPKVHSVNMAFQAEAEIQVLEQSGIQALTVLGNHHRKLAILDRKILWEGSLNILSQNNSHEIMRRIKSEELATEMFNFLKLNRFIHW